MGVTREFLPPSLLPLKERGWKLVPETPLSKSQKTQKRTSWNQTKRLSASRQSKPTIKTPPADREKTFWNQTTINAEPTLPGSPEPLKNSTPRLLVLTLLHTSLKALEGKRAQGFLGRDFEQGALRPGPHYGCFDSAPGCPGCLSC